MKELSLQNCRLDNRYDVQALLGRGSYAEIYVARDILVPADAPHSQVVIKALNVFMQDDLDADLERTLVENFQNEAIALDRVRHPNIISRLGHGTAKDLNGMVFHYLVLEYLSGGDLAKNCPKTGLPIEKVLGYLEQVCAGLAHAHKCGVIHRDIKPQNLLLTGDRKTVKIADFGVARFSQNDAPITRVGTNMYAPPEHSPMIADGVATIVKLTPAADVYSLAKSAYVLITGESPRRFSNFPISELPDLVRQKFWANEFLRVLRRATQNDPQERPQNVNEFWQELSRVNFFDTPEEADEPETQISKPRPHLVPQPKITPDYSPNAPLRPKFDTSRELKFRNETLEEPSPPLVVKLNPNGNSQASPSPQPKPLSETESGKPIVVDLAPLPPTPARIFMRRSLIIGLFLLTFAGGLFITQNYLRTSQVLPEIQNPFGKYPEGVAVQDINLRSTPGVEKPPVGLVPKGARVKITETKDNWIKIDIIEPARSDNTNEEKSGWVNKRYIDVQEL